MALSMASDASELVRFAKAPLWRSLPGRLVAMLAFTAAWPAGFGQSTQVLTNLSQVQSLAMDVAAKGLRVELKAAVTYSDPEWRMMFVQDGAASAYVQRSLPSDDPTWNLRPGQVIRIEGITGRSVKQPNIVESKLTVMDQTNVPVFLPLDSEESYRRANDTRWVKVSGFISRMTGQFGTKSQLEICAHPGRLMELPILDGQAPQAAALVGCQVEATGVFGLKLDADHQPTATNVIWVPGMAWIHNARPVSVTDIGDLSAPAGRRDGETPKHIRGYVVSQQPGKFAVVHDHSGSIRVNCNTPDRFEAGRPVDFIGFAEMQGHELVLDGAVVLAKNTSGGAATGLFEGAVASTADTNLNLLTQVIQVRSLSLAEAIRGYPVKVTGVLTYSDPIQQIQFIQDESGGIFLHLTHKQFDALPPAGMRVEIRGFSGPGDFAPVIEVEQMRLLGPGDFPARNAVPVQTLVSGSLDSQWTTLYGVVRSQAVDASNTVLSVSVADSRITVIVPEVSRHPAPVNYIDAAVEVQGVCATIFDERRRLTGIRFYVPGWNQMRVQEAGPGDAFTLPVRPVSELLRFRAAGGVHRSHVHGAVVLCRDGGSFYLQDDTGGVLVQPEENAAAPKTGDQVDLIGFPEVLGKLPVLRDAVVKVTGTRASPKPVRMGEELPFDEDLNGMLVQLRGQVVGHATSTAQEWLSVQFGQWITDAVLEKGQHADQMNKMLPGSVVQLTGVYAARLDENRKVQSFQLLLRSPADVAVLSRPSWWTAGHTFWVLGISGVVLALALGWINMLHRQVRIQTGQLREEIEERKRMEARVEQTHKALVEASRNAGMAEVATSVLHNVGNVLNSVNVSTAVVRDRVRQSRSRQVGKIVSTLREHSGNLDEFLTRDPKGSLLIDYMGQLSEHLATEREEMLKELDSLTGYVEHIKEIVAMQQNYAKTTGGVLEVFPVLDVVEDALRVNTGTFERHQVETVRDFQKGLPNITTDKHKVLQILINLLRNAKYACDDANRPDKRVIVRVRAEGGRIHIQVVDNGIGIPAENLTRIFNHGFTTRTGGHGFGLHSGALAARELGGQLRVQSEGPGRGATFTLELPLQAEEETAQVP